MKLLAAKQAENLDLARKLSIEEETDERNKRGNKLFCISRIDPGVAIEYLEKSLEAQKVKVQKLKELFDKMNEQKKHLDVCIL